MTRQVLSTPPPPRRWCPSGPPPPASSPSQTTPPPAPVRGRRQRTGRFLLALPGPSSPRTLAPSSKQLLRLHPGQGCCLVGGETSQRRQGCWRLVFWPSPGCQDCRCCCWLWWWRWWWFEEGWGLYNDRPRRRWRSCGCGPGGSRG